MNNSKRIFARRMAKPVDLSALKQARGGMWVRTVCTCGETCDSADDSGVLA